MIGGVMVSSEIYEVVQDQWGLVTRRQMVRIGVPETTIERLTKPGVVFERVATGVYRLLGAPIPEHLELRVAWLQLAPGVFAWERTPSQGVVSHRSAAAVYKLGHLPADNHDFTVVERHQTRRSDVRLHQRQLHNTECTTVQGLPVTKPARIISDLLYDNEDPESIAQILVDALNNHLDTPQNCIDSLRPHAFKFGFRRGDGTAVFRWLGELIDPQSTVRWIGQPNNEIADAA